MTLVEKYFTIVAIMTARYAVIAGGYYFITWVALRRRIQKYVVNTKSIFSGQLLFELKYSALTTFIFAAAGLHFYLAKEYDLGKIYPDVATHGWGYFVFSIFAMLAINDVYFYWTHRLLHWKPLFSRFHSVHHRSRVTTPLTSQSFHGVETVVNVLIAVAYPYMFPVHPGAFVAFTLIAFVNNVYGHGNIDWIQEPRRSLAPFKFLNSPSVHGAHHFRVVGNYGLYTNIWDRLHGTYFSPFESFDDRVAGLEGGGEISGAVTTSENRRPLPSFADKNDLPQLHL